jgi:two-component system, OmpR family, response regulator
MALEAGGSGAPRSRDIAGTAERARLPLVLLVDDDTAWRTGLAGYFRANGFDCAEFGGFTALADFLRSADGLFVIVADLTAGSRHLFDCLTDIAHLWGAAVLVLSSQRDETETIVALELGADDVIGKSTDRREILARVRAAARRLQTRQALLRPTPGGPQAESAAAPVSWRFLPDRRELTDPQGQLVLLTTAEFKLLEAFVANTGRPLHRRDLAAAVLGRPYDASDRSIDNLVAKLRRKLGDPAKQARMIKTARPLGYVFTGLTAPADRAPDPARPAEPVTNAETLSLLKHL